MIENIYNDFISIIRKFTNNTKRNNDESKKRTINYLEWCKTKTDIIDKEQHFTLSASQEALIKRGNVLWVDFGFNIGSEFGGQHPALIIRKMGKGVYVIPIDSGKIPDDKKDKTYFVSIPYIHGFPKLPRYCNVYNMMKIDPRRFDFNSPCGKVHGKIMDKIRVALQKNIIS